MVSYYEDKGFIEASLGGKLTPGELTVFSEELLELVDAFKGRPYQLLLDYSRASGLNPTALFALGEIRDRCHERGAAQIVSVTPGEADLEHETAHRLQHVMAGTEAFVLDPAYAKFAPLGYESAVLRAA
ncbi:MAG: hypothetical protein ACYC96_02980 [Fimbriimonadaceae bacterium]